MSEYRPPPNCEDCVFNYDTIKCRAWEAVDPRQEGRCSDFYAQWGDGCGDVPDNCPIKTGKIRLELL